MMTVVSWQQLQDIADRVDVHVQLTNIHVTDRESVNPIKRCVKRLTWTLED